MTLRTILALYSLASAWEIYLFLMQRAALEVSRASNLEQRVGRQMLPLWYFSVWPTKLGRFALLYLIWSRAGWLSLCVAFGLVMIATTVLPVPFEHFRPMFMRKLLRDMLTENEANAPELMVALMKFHADPEPQPTSATAIPSRFDLDDVMHVTIIDEIRDKYSLLLADDSHPYSRCMYRPASLLPYPKEVIRRALEALLDFIEGRRQSRVLVASIRSPQVADTISASLDSLDDFLDVPAEQLPTDVSENARVGLRLLRSQS